MKGLLIALLLVTAEPQGFWTGPVNDPVPATIQGGKVIHTQQLNELLQNSKPLVIDVSDSPRRPENFPATSTWLPKPHPGIPGAIWIPGAGLAAPPADVEQRYKQQLGSDLSRLIVVYCHEKCWLSWNGAKRAIQYGYTNVYWYPDGIEGWRKAKLPTEVLKP